MNKSLPVDHFMKIHVVKVDDDSTVEEAEEKMREHDIHKILVTDDEVPKYIISDWKLWGLEKSEKIKKFTEDFEEVCVVASGTIMTAIYPMLKEKSAVVVQDVKREKILGILTASDLVRNTPT